MSVRLDLYLDAIGLSTMVIALIFTAVLPGGAVVTILITTAPDTFGRKQVLILARRAAQAVAGCVFAVTSNSLVLAVAVFGTISPFGKEVGPFLSIEQAILPQTSEDLYRTRVFSAYNLVGSIFGSFGAYAVVHPEERAASAGILSVSRNTGAAIAPLFTAPILVNPVLGLPFLLAGGLNPDSAVKTYDIEGAEKKDNGSDCLG